jgi:hypothetical protein
VQGEQRERVQEEGYAGRDHEPGDRQDDPGVAALIVPPPPRDEPGDDARNDAGSDEEEDDRADPRACG